jgi:hypothetical protein
MHENFTKHKCAEGSGNVSQAKRREIMPGVTLTAVKTRKFKTSCIGLNLLVPLHPEEAAKHALLPSVLRRGTAAKPDMEQLSGALDELYGAYMEPSIRKKGEAHASGFICSFIDDAYTPGGEPLLERVCALLGDMLLRPATRNGRFLQDYVRASGITSSTGSAPRKTTNGSMPCSGLPR